MDALIHNDLFSALISDIKSYNGEDPLLPWLRGINKMRDSLPPPLLNDKLPRFLQKCALTFLKDRRYSNDMRYLRVWLQLMDYMDDPKALLKSMELNRIGMKRSLFYQAYALYYEKIKKYAAAERMYRLGVNNLAEPLDELHKSYDQFLHRVEQRKSKRIQRLEGRSKICSGRAQNLTLEDNNGNLNGLAENPVITKDQLPNAQSEHINMEYRVPISRGSGKGSQNNEANLSGPAPQKAEADKSRKFSGEDTIIVKKFVGNAIVGKSDVEDARHHGLVEPTINTKEAIHAINSMFREPLESSIAGKQYRRNQPKVDQRSNNDFEVFIDECKDSAARSSHQTLSNGSSVPQTIRLETQEPVPQPLQIYIDDDDTDDVIEGGNTHNLTGCTMEDRIVKGFVFPSPSDVTSAISRASSAESPPRTRLRREDTVVSKFVGHTISEESEVENVCHHGLVEPTINLKEAMADINSMFGKPIEFTRKRKPKKRESTLKTERYGSGFLILPDDEMQHQPKSSLPTSLTKRGSDLFEKTMCTKEAMDEINKMFAMPLDF